MYTFSNECEKVTAQTSPYTVRLKLSTGGTTRKTWRLQTDYLYQEMLKVVDSLCQCIVVVG